MKQKDALSGYHPLIPFLYFGLVLLFSMILIHPVCLGISFTCALAYSVSFSGGKALRIHLRYMLPLFLTAALLNPAFNHQGMTILWYFPGGNPLTLESIAFGIAAAVLLAEVILWFQCYSEVMTSDKFVYLFGRVIPAMSLILSMTLRFVPKFKAQLKVVSDAQKCVGRDASQGNVIKRARNGVTILSIMVTWALENAIETADSMKSRGYGLMGRTAFSIYRFDRRDLAALLFLLACGGYIVAGACLGGVSYRYFPAIKGVSLGAYPVSIFLCYFALCVMPLIMRLMEDRKWKAIQSAA